MINIVDISYPIDRNTVIYPGNPGIDIKHVLDINKGDSANVSIISMGSHTGTHIDAPAHYIDGGVTIDKIPLERMCGRAVLADVTGAEDIGLKTIQDMDLHKDDIVLFKTSTSLKWSCDRILDDYPTLSYEVADCFAQMGIKLVGIDYLTIERPKNKREEGKSIHRSLLSNNVMIVEGLRLRNVEPGEYGFYCLPLNICGVDGCPARCVLIDEGHKE